LQTEKQLGNTYNSQELHCYQHAEYMFCIY